MNRSEKIELLRRIQAGGASVLDTEPIAVIFCDQELPEKERKYYISRDNKPVEISGEAIDRITTDKVFCDFQDIKL